MTVTSERERRFTVLLVEDDADHAELVRRGLLEHIPSCILHHARDGQDALDRLQGHGVHEGEALRPDLILLDLRLPRLDGMAVLSSIKASPTLQSIPTVVLTSSSAERDVTEAYVRHANSYLVKPLDLEAFDRLMKDLGLYWISWNQPPRQ